MKPTLLIGDHILVGKFVYAIKIPFLNKELIHFSEPKRGDIVVFEYPKDPSKDFIKRVIGIPGDTISIRDKKVYVNDNVLHEPYVVHSDNNTLPPETSPRDNVDRILVPPGSLFVMGDNRDESLDSRFWKFVAISALKGKAFIIYWSWNHNGELSFDSGHSYIRWNRLAKLVH